MKKYLCNECNKMVEHSKIDGEINQLAEDDGNKDGFVCVDCVRKL